MTQAGGCGCRGLSGGWSDWFRDITTGWSSAGQQILLNQNQAKAMEVTPQGTVVYQTGAGTPGAVAPLQQAATVEGVARATTSGVAVLAIAGLAIYLIISRRDD